MAVVSEALGNVGVNIEAISAYEKNDRAVFRLLTNDVNTTMKALSKVPDVTARSEDVIVLRLVNRPGELAKITRKLANKSVNLESLYIVSKASDFTEVAVKPSEADFEKAKGVLGVK